MSEVCEVKEMWNTVSSLVDGVKRYYVLLTAVRLSLFDHLRSPHCVDELADRLSCRREILEGVCKSLVDMSLLRMMEDGRYVNTDVANMYFLKDGVQSICDAIQSLESDIFIWQKLPEVLFDGPVVLSKEGFFAKHVIHRMAVEALCGELQKSIEIITSVTGFDGVRKMLDLGGGHGLYAITLVVNKPDLVAYVFDLPGVVGETRKYIKRFGVEDRVFTIAGNFFTDDIGVDYDMVFSSYNPGGKDPEVVRKIFDSLNDGGIFVSKQSFHTQKKDSNPLEELWWNLWKIDGVSKGRKRYTFERDIPTVEDYLIFLERLGFEILRVEEFSDFDRMIITRKR